MTILGLFIRRLLGRPVPVEWKPSTIRRDPALAIDPKHRPYDNNKAPAAKRRADALEVQRRRLAALRACPPPAPRKRPAIRIAKTGTR